MTEKKYFKIKDLIPIREIKEDINLFMFNSARFSTSDMVRNNKLIEVVANVEIKIPVNN